MQVYGPQVPRAPGPTATPSDLGKCTSIQAQCALEIGGSCDRNTGHWCYGTVFARNCGGSNYSGEFDRRVLRKLGEHKQNSHAIACRVGYLSGPYLMPVRNASPARTVITAANVTSAASEPATADNSAMPITGSELPAKQTTR